MAANQDHDLVGTGLAAQVCVIALAVTCFGSFIWALRSFFTRGARVAVQMSLMKVTGALSLVAHLMGLAFAPAFCQLRMALAGSIYAMSLVIFWWAIESTRNRRLPIAFSTISSAHLVLSGPFGWIRHPIYLSYMLAWSAGGIAIQPVWSWVVLPIMAGQYWQAIRHEERQFLNGPLGEAYRAYMLQTGMLLPRSRNRVNLIRKKAS